MKVIMFTDTLVQINGASKHIILLTRELEKIGVDVAIYCGKSPKGLKTINNPSIPFPLFKEYEIVFPIKRTKSDIHHIHSPYLVGWKGMLSKKPKVVTTHTGPEHMTSLISKKLNPVALRYLIYFYSKADHIIYQTNATKNFFESNGLKKPSSIISAGIDVKKFSKADPEKFRELYDVPDKFVLSPVRLSPEKRPDWTLKACEELDIPVVVISDGPMRNDLERKFPNATFLGYIPTQYIPSAFSAAEIAVIPSLFETECLTAYECLAAGTPIITTKLDVFEDYLIDGYNAYLFSSYQELKEKLLKLWNEERLRRKMVKNGKDVLRVKDIRFVARKIKEVYELLLEGHSP